MLIVIYVFHKIAKGSNLSLREPYKFFIIIWLVSKFSIRGFQLRNKGTLQRSEKFRLIIAHCLGL